MIKTILFALAAFAAITFAGLSGQAVAQDCSSCGPAPSISSFGFPSAPAAGCGRAGCRSGHGHGQFKQHIHEFKQQLDHTAAINAKIAARNDAWPLPFACADKRDYYHIWNTMLSSGSETQAVLDGNYFTDTNHLNRVGIDRVAGIVLNMPSSERTVYVNRGPDQSVNQARIESIQNTVSTYYGHIAGVSVQLSNHLPDSDSASAVLNMQTIRNTQLPAAIIPVGDGESVTQAVTQ